MYIDNYVFESYDALMIYEPCCVLCCVLLNEGRIRINNRNSRSKVFFLIYLFNIILLQPSTRIHSDETFMCVLENCPVLLIFLTVVLKMNKQY